MKKIIAAVLLIASLFVTSCAGEPVTLLSFIDPDADGAVNYGGVELIISSIQNSMSGDETYWSRILSYDTNTVIGEGILERVASIEDKLGVKIGWDTDPDGDATIRMKLVAGTYVADIVNYFSFGAMENFASAGLLYPMTGFEHIDLSETWKYGNANVLEGAMVNSVPYAVQPVSWLGWEPTGISAILYNRELLQDYALTDPHEFWESESWYWDTFESTYLEPQITLDEGDWILSASEKIFWYGLLYSNDVQFVSVNETGDYSVNSKPQSLIEAVQEGLDWYGNHTDIVDLYDDYWSIRDYSDGLAVFTVTTAENAYNGMNDIESSIMPFPCGPSATYGTWRQAFDRIEGFGIPINAPEPDIAAHVISELFEPLDEYLGMTLDEYYRSMMFLTETDADIYAEIIKDVRYDYTFHGGMDLMRAVNNSFSKGIKSKKAANETVETLSSQINSIITEYALPNYDYMYKNFYSLENAD